MKTFCFLLLCAVATASAQNISSKSNEINLDYGSGKSYSTSAPSISWLQPIIETSYSKEGKLSVQIEIKSKDALKNVTIAFKDKITGALIRESKVKFEEEDQYRLKIERNLTLPEGILIVEVSAENTEGIKSISSKIAYSGETVVAEATKLDRQDYALIFVTDKYDNWTQLANPVFDGRTISQSLQKNYGFKTEVVENASREQVFLKMREYAEKKFNPLDQLLVFFAGHGFYDPTFKEGFLVPRESIQDDPARLAILAIVNCEVPSTITPASIFYW